VEAQLTHPLAIGDQPFIVPIREQFAGLGQQLKEAIIVGRRSLRQPMRQLRQITNIDSDLRIECDIARRHGEKPPACTLEAPEGGSQAAERSITRRIRPQSAGQLRPCLRAITKRDGREDSALTTWHVDRSAIHRELESAEEPEAGAERA
jgi:hypothetical protein